MATVTVGKLVVDLDRVSDEEDRELLEQFGSDNELTDAVVAALGRYSKAHGGGSSSTNGEESKASRIRRLAAAGMSKGDIAKALDIRFQFVYNVLQKDALKAK